MTGRIRTYASTFQPALPRSCANPANSLGIYLGYNHHVNKPPIFAAGGSDQWKPEMKPDRYKSIKFITIVITHAIVKQIKNLFPLNGS